MTEMVDIFEDIEKSEKFNDLKFSERTLIEDTKKDIIKIIDMIKDEEKSEVDKKKVAEKWYNKINEKLKPIKTISAILVNSPKILDMIKSVYEYF